MKKAALRWLVVVAALIMTLTAPLAMARDEDFWAEVGIIFYDPSDSGSGGCLSNSLTGGTITISPGAAGFDRLREAVRQHGELAMELQREFGVPWDVVFAQMQKESGTGTTGIAISGAHNNWLGIGGTGDAGSWTAPNGRRWAVYSSVEGSIADWAGRRVLRNGMYDGAFIHLNPHAWNMEAFLRDMIAVYSPASDGNNVEQYINVVLALLNGPIREVQEEMGWPTSAELAANENIEPGGRTPLGSAVIGSPGGWAAQCVLQSGGMTVSQAEAWLLRTGYNDLSNDIHIEFQLPGWNADIWCGLPGRHGSRRNCVGFSTFFVRAFTSLGDAHRQLGAVGNGGGFVSVLAGIGNVQVGTVPQVYSIFSYGPVTWGHTGVILGIEGDTLIIAEAGCHSFDGRIMTRSISSMPSDTVYAYLAPFINTGGF